MPQYDSPPTTCLASVDDTSCQPGLLLAIKADEHAASTNMQAEALKTDTRLILTPPYYENPETNDARTNQRCDD